CCRKETIFDFHRLLPSNPMQIFLLIAGIILFFFLLVLRQSAGKPEVTDSRPEQNTTRPSEEYKPSSKVPNDKMVIVSGLRDDDFRKAVKQFCNLNNQEDYMVMPLITKVSD